jgi:hypothetical protein
MNGAEHLRQTLDYYRQQLQKKLEELAPLQLMIRQLERELGDSSNTPDLSDLATGGTSAGLPPFAPFGAERSTDIRPDEFYGMSQSEAAKAYLKKVGRAISLDELVSALNKGGAKVGGASPKKTLYVSLMRNPLREFVTPSENHIGLRAFYPGLPKTEKSAKTGKAKKGKHGPKPRGIKRGSAASKPTPAAGKAKAGDTNSTPLKDLIHEIVGRGDPKTVDEIVREVEGKLGKVSKIAVHGALRSKAFRQVEGKYQVA